MAKQYTLEDLTDGKFKTLGDLTVEGIEELIKIRFDMNGNNLAPLSQRDGTPILKPDGSQLVLPYKHACAFVGYVLGKIYPDQKPTHVSQIDPSLPIPFWTPTDVIMLTADEKVVIATRGKNNPNAMGYSLTAAAGNMQVVNGIPDTPEVCAARELAEEVGLVWSAVAERSAEVAYADSRKLQTYKLKGMRDGQEVDIQGIVPNLARYFALQTKDTWDALKDKIRLNHEGCGIVVVDAVDYRRMASGAVPNAPVTFYPSSGYPGVFDGCKTMTDVRQRLIEDEVPMLKASTPAERVVYTLLEGQSKTYHVDDTLNNGRETVDNTIKALDLMIAAKPTLQKRLGNIVKRYRTAAVAFSLGLLAGFGVCYLMHDSNAMPKTSMAATAQPDENAEGHKKSSSIIWSCSVGQPMDNALDCVPIKDGVKGNPVSVPLNFRANYAFTEEANRAFADAVAVAKAVYGEGLKGKAALERIDARLAASSPR